MPDTNPTTLDLLARAESYLSALHGSVARHDNLGVNLGCAGCELRDQIRAAAAVPVPAPTDPAARRDRIAEVLWPLIGWDATRLNAERAADAVLAVLPPTAENAALWDELHRRDTETDRPHGAPTDRAARSERYAAAIRETDGWVLDGGQHMVAAVMAVADTEQAELRERHKASLRRADQINNQLMEEVQRYTEGTEQPVLWSTYNRMHLRAANAEGDLESARRIVRRLTAHAIGFQDVLDETDRGPWGRTVGADIAELCAALDGVSGPGRVADDEGDELVCVDECGSCDACGMEPFGTPAEGWREAARFLRRTARESGDRQGALHGARLIEAELRRVADEAQQPASRADSHEQAAEQIREAARRLYADTGIRVLAALDGAQQPETQAEDPARIDRLRPEFTEHSSVEAIDVQLRRARAQQRRWHIRVEWLISLRAARVEQKARGTWPAAVSQPGKEN